MEKNFKKFLVMLVALSMVFTMTAVPVYADDMSAEQEAETVLVTEENYEEVEIVEEAAPEEALAEEVTEPVTPEAIEEAVPEAVEEIAPEEAAVPQDNEIPADNTETAAAETEEITEVSGPEEVVAEEATAATEKVSEAIVKLAAANETEETVSKIAYSGEGVNFIKEDGSGFGMFAPQDGTTIEIKGENVVIHYVPKNVTTYAGFNWGSIGKAEYTDGSAQPGIEVKANSDGTYDMTLSKDHCGYAHPLAVVKNTFSKDSWTSGDQYYLAIPSEDKIPAAEEEVDKFAYSGEGVNFIKEDGSGFGMFAPQDGTTIEIKGDNVVIHYVPKNVTTYAGFNWGSIGKAEYTDGSAQPGIEVKANPDGTYDMTLSKDHCGYAHPLAVVKNTFSKDSWTSGDQYYLAIPAEDKIPADSDPVTPDDPTPVDPSEDDLVGTDLTITNEATMFKVVSAKLVTENGKEYLVFAMNGTGYHELFKGTEAQAIANGDGSKDKGNDTWIHGAVNSDGKWEFKLPLSNGESYVPISSVSDRNYKDYLEGKRKLDELFYGKQLKINRNAKTLLVEDYSAEDDKVTPDSDKPVPEDKDKTPSDSGESSYAPAVDSSTTLPDGVYTPDSFSWSGGTGRLTISCTQITVKDGQAYATIVFSSSSVDQLKANGSIYYKEGSGPSTFTIPVNLNANNTIIGRTTAMSQPHWVEYTIYIGLAENEEQAEKAKQAKKDAAEAKLKISEEAPAIVGLEAKETQPTIDYSKYFKIFEYEHDVKMISIDISENTALDEEYKKNAEKAIEASKSEEQVQYDENGKAISKPKEEYTAEMYKNKVVNYLLVPEDFELPAGLDKQYIIINVPAEKTFMASEEVIAMMEELGCLDAISLLGIDEKDVKNEDLKKALKDEKIKLAGNLEKPDYAKVVKDKSDLAVFSGDVLPEKIDEKAKDKDKEKLTEEAKAKQEALENIESRFAALEVPIVIDRSAQEEDELAQAEWIKVYGALFGCDDEAEKLFEKKVKELKNNGKN